MKILMVEDGALFSELLGQTLSRESGLSMAGEAKDGETALKTETVGCGLHDISAW